MRRVITLALEYIPKIAPHNFAKEKHSVRADSGVR